jgi:uncharacterized membrane protein YdbT with pleckstrin-like domain
MPKVINPTPIVAQAKMVLLAIILTVLLYMVSNYIKGIFVQAVLAVWFLAALGCGLFFITTRFITLEIREKDLLFRRGILSVRTVLISYDKITDTRYTQSLFERIFGVGTL